jgi:hypothetical protein
MPRRRVPLPSFIDAGRFAIPDCPGADELGRVDCPPSRGRASSRKYAGSYASAKGFLTLLLAPRFFTTVCPDAAAAMGALAHGGALCFS